MRQMRAHACIEATQCGTDSGRDRDLKDFFLATASGLQGSDVSIGDAIGRTIDLRDVGIQWGWHPVS
jgi:hypothetical protein